jgi:putative ABC transport system permease protein
MGMKKNAVAIGLWIELLAVACICFALGLGAGSVLSQPVSDSILSEITRVPDTRASTLADRLNENGGAGTEKIGVAVSGVTAVEILALTVAIVTAAGFISVSRITRSEPVKILMERD